jgi:WD40 repeat protein
MSHVVRSSANHRRDDGEPVSLGRSRCSAVRLSLFSRESLMLVFLAGLVGFWIFPGYDQSLQRSPGRITLRGHDNLVDDVIFAPDGRSLLSSGWDGHVRMWNLRSDESGIGNQIDDIPSNWHVFSIATTPDGNYLAAAGLGGFRVWRRADSSGWQMFAEEQGLGRRCVAAAADGRTLALGGLDGTVRLWDIQTRTETHVLRGFSDDVRAVQFSPDGEYLAANTFGGAFQLWKLYPDPRPVPDRNRADFVQVFRFAPDNRTLALACRQEPFMNVILREYRNGTVCRKLAATAWGINALVFSPNGQILATADQDQSIRFWDMRTGQIEAIVTKGVGWVKTLAYAPDGRRIAFGGRNGLLQILELDQRNMPEAAERTGKLG